MQRVTNQMINNTMIHNLNRHQAEMDKTQNMLGTGKNVRFPRDNPIATTSQMIYQSRLTEVDQYIQNLGEAKSRVACIGLAGERQVKLAGIANDHGRFAARTGLGAVMGSKNLKAIAVRGSGKVPLHAPDEFKALTNQALALLKGDTPSQSLREFGTAGYLNLAHMLSDLPLRYFQLGEYAPADALSGVDMAEHFLRRNTACHKCGIACGRETRSPAYNDDRVDGPEYETLGSFGSACGIDDQRRTDLRCSSGRFHRPRNPGHPPARAGKKQSGNCPDPLPLSGHGQKLHQPDLSENQCQRQGQCRGKESIRIRTWSLSCRCRQSHRTEHQKRRSSMSFQS